MVKLSIEKLKQLPTKRILAYYKKYGHAWKGKYFCCRCEVFLCDYVCPLKDLQALNEEEFYWKSIKAILNTREHVSK